MRISDWSSDVCSSDLPWDHTRSSASAPMAAKGPWPCLSGVDCPGSTTGDAALSSALVERDVETLVAALIAAFFIVAGIGGRVRPFQFRLRDRERRSDEHTSELQSLMRISYPVFCLKKQIRH